MHDNWSQKFELTKESIKGNAPNKSGVFKIIQSVDYPRYFGNTKILKIGMSKSDLQVELLRHLNQHTAANRLARIRRHKIQVFFRYFNCSPEEAEDAERDLLKVFEDKHWDLPVLNSTRGYRRGED
jgi:hypothetical protein